jgi:hypothetical protein
VVINRPEQAISEIIMASKATREPVAVADSPAAGSEDVRRIMGAETALKPSRLPSALRFPIIVILSLGWTAVGYSTIAQWTSDDLGAFARLMSQKEMALLLAWRVYVYLPSVHLV